MGSAASRVTPQGRGGGSTPESTLYRVFFLSGQLQGSIEGSWPLGPTGARCGNQHTPSAPPVCPLLPPSKIRWVSQVHQLTASLRPESRIPAGQCRLAFSLGTQRPCPRMASRRISSCLWRRPGVRASNAGPWKVGKTLLDSREDSTAGSWGPWGAGGCAQAGPAGLGEAPWVTREMAPAWSPGFQ